MSTLLSVRRAEPDDAERLTQLAFRSKASWGYDEAFMDSAKSALTISPADIRSHHVFLFNREERTVGFFAFRAEANETLLDDFWLEPEFKGTGLGRAMWESAITEARALGYRAFFIHSDPNAEGFYLQMGARRIGTQLAPETGRELPLLQFDIPAAVDVYVARHGETTWNAVGRYQGHIDSPLSALGEAQSRALAGALTEKRVGRFVSSPLSRCIRTALPLASILRIEVETDPLLLEIAHGTWEGRYREEIARNDPDRYRTWREHPERVAFDGGESLADVFDRWKQFAAAFAPHENTLIVTHDIVLRAAVLEQTGRPMAELRSVRAPNAAYAWFQYADGAWSLREECIADHLAQLGDAGKVARSSGI